MDIEQHHIDDKAKEWERIESTLAEVDDTNFMIIKAHLISEYLLERITIGFLPRGDKIIESGNLSFNQKLKLVDSFDCLSDGAVSSLRNLNKLRNQCAHNLEVSITDIDISRIGSPHGKIFTGIKKKHGKHNSSLLRAVLDTNFGALVACAHHAEKP